MSICYRDRSSRLVLSPGRFYRSDMFGYRVRCILIVSVLTTGTANVKMSMADLLAEQFTPFSKTKTVAPSGLSIETSLNVGDRLPRT